MKCSEKFDKVVYDSNPILYYCFNHKERIKGVQITCRVIEFTQKSLDYTQHFITGKIGIETISQVIDEIFQKGLAKIVNEYCDNIYTKDLMGIRRSRNVPYAIKLRLSVKTEDKIKQLLKKPWFNVVDYKINSAKIEKIKDFYKSLNSTPKMISHMRDKKRSIPWPSNVDMLLLAYSKENHAPILTNDTDFTNFTGELESAGVCFGIIALK
jgi:hypothetical protein